VTPRRVALAVGATALAAAAVPASRAAYRSLLAWTLESVATARGPPSAAAGIALTLCTSLYGDSKLLDFQDLLPPLPLPELKETLERWLESVRPLVSDDEFKAAEAAAARFLEPGKRGTRLHAILAALQSASRTGDCLAALPKNPDGSEQASWRGIGRGNWLAPFWLRVAYLMYRAPLPVNVSFYSTDQLRLPLKTTSQATRAAGVALGLMEFFDRVVTGSLPPFFIGSSSAKVPVDMSGYHWMLGGNRTAIEGVDEQRVHQVPRHESQAESDPRRMGDAHILVMRGTALFVVPIQRNGKRVSFLELRGVMQSIVDAVSTPSVLCTPREHGAEAVEPSNWSFPDSPPLTLLTTWDRDSWASSRKRLLDGPWGDGLHACESSLFGIRLFFETSAEAGGATTGIGKERLGACDDAVPDATADWPEVSDRVNRLARTGFTGDGFHWWCDKTVSFGAFADGVGCWNIEHTPADAPVPSHFVEHALVREAGIAAEAVEGRSSEDAWKVKKLSLQSNKYPDLPAPAPVNAMSPFAPKRLQFATSHETDWVQENLVEASTAFRELVASTGMFVGVFEDWGTKTIKSKFQCAPDAFFQSVLQVASRCHFGHPVLTYESASTRAFRHGRTETIRSASSAMTELSAMVQPLVGEASVGADTAASILKSLRTACGQHKKLTQAAMRGEGVDRHLLGLRIMDQMAATTGMLPGDSTDPFWTTPAWAALNYQLSTSQTPLVQEHWGTLTGPEVVSFGGGFGPTADDGVGVSYFLLDRYLYFHCSCNRDEPHAAPHLRVGEVCASAGSPMWNAHSFASTVRRVLRTFEAVARAAEPDVWSDAKRDSRL
jgi:hypothetical protein